MVFKPFYFSLSIDLMMETAMEGGGWNQRCQVIVVDPENNSSHIIKEEDVVSSTSQPFDALKGSVPLQGSKRI